MKVKIITALASLLSLSGSLAFAGGPELAPPQDTLHAHRMLPPPARWMLSSDLFLWGVNMTGHISLNSRQTQPTGQEQKFLRHMRSTGMFWLGASKGPFSLFLHGFYGELKYTRNISGENQVTRNSFSMALAGLSYRAYKHIIYQNNRYVSSSFSIVPYTGLRLLATNSHIEQEGVHLADRNEWWLQPVVGSRFILQFKRHWDLFAATDFALWDANNQSYNSMLMLQYNKLFGVPVLSFNIGYRYMYTKYQYDGDTFDWHMNLYGPLFGMSLTI